MRHLRGTEHPLVFIGNIQDANNRSQLIEDVVMVIVNVCNDIQSKIYPTFYYVKWGLDDPAETLAPHNNVIAAAVVLQEAVLQARSINGNVLIHCAAGNNRSPLVAAVWLEQFCDWDFKEAVKAAEVKDRKNWMIDKGFNW